jgi:hydroxymethylglutaryl-CoA lyase
VVKIVECPRDAMQGIVPMIPAERKARYLNALLRAGFHTLDFGSFVSPQAVPQMADTAQVLEMLEWESSPTRLLAIVANLRGAEEACAYPQISELGYPFSISETFQLRNTRRTIDASLPLVEEMLECCDKHGKGLTVYLSMAFGNPYGDPWSEEAAAGWAERLAGLGLRTLALADTAGCATEAAIRSLFSALIPCFPEVEFGAHFHSHPASRRAKLAAAWEAGCRRFDTALGGFGGCPFAQDELVGNISTESLLDYCKENSIETGIDPAAWEAALAIAPEVFGS